MKHIVTTEAAKLNNLEAIRIIEEDDNSNEDQWLAAWQHLVNDGIVWQLQGIYQRMAMRLVNDGLVKLPDREVDAK